MTVSVRGPAAALLLLFAAAAVSPAAEEAEFQEPRVSRDSWKVAVARFDIQGALSARDQALISAAAVIPRLILAELEGADYHELSENETNLLAADAIRARIISVNKELPALYSGRDALFFDLNSDPDALKTIEAKIRELSGELEYLRGFPVSAVVTPESLPVEFPPAFGGGEIWEVAEGYPEAYRDEMNLDILITGSIVRVGDYFGFRILGYGKEGESIIWEGAGNENEFERISKEAGGLARREVLGRPWSALTVVTDPPNALITVNGLAGGVGSWSDTTLRPGEVVVEITAPGHKPQVFTETLSPGETREFPIQLEKTVQRQILVRTDPPGASLTLGSIWLGRTPIAVNVPDRVMPVEVEMDGYRSRTVPLYPDAERLTIPLEYILADPEEQLAKYRKQLYNSIALFSFSLAPTVILLGVSQNYANMNFASTTPEDYEYSYNAYRLTYGLMWGSVAINLGLLTNVFIRLSRYLRAAEDLSD